MDDLSSSLKAAKENAPAAQRLMAKSGTLSEPMAAFACRLRNFLPDIEQYQHQRRLMMVIDVGAGTTDFAMFARYPHEGKMKVCHVKNSMETIRVAEDKIDRALMDYMLSQTNLAESDSRYGAISAELGREIRLVKEELFRN